MARGLVRASGLAILCLLLIPEHLPMAQENRPRVEIRLVRRSPTPGYALAPGPKPPEKLFLAGEPLYSARDFEGARMANLGTQMAILLTFAPEASKRLASYTRRHRGRELALLLDGRVLLVTRIADPILGGEMTLMGEVSYADAKAVCEALRTPPHPP